MSPIEKEILRRKISVIVENLNALELIKNMTREQYADDIYKRKATERLLQELIEAAIDINTHIIVQTSNIVPDDYYESFIKLGELKIMTAKLAEKLAPSAGLRNRLVHEEQLAWLAPSPPECMSGWRTSACRLSGRDSSGQTDRESGFLPVTCGCFVWHNVAVCYILVWYCLLQSVRLFCRNRRFV